MGHNCIWSVSLPPSSDLCTSVQKLTVTWSWHQAAGEGTWLPPPLRLILVALSSHEPSSFLWQPHLALSTFLSVVTELTLVYAVSLSGSMSPSAWMCLIRLLEVHKLLGLSGKSLKAQLGQTFKPLTVQAQWLSLQLCKAASGIEVGEFILFLRDG